MEDREVVSKDELSQWITDYVCKYPDCEGTKVSVQFKLKEPDHEGCNWSSDVVFNLGPNADKTQVTTHVGNAIREARDKFNLEK